MFAQLHTVLATACNIGGLIILIAGALIVAWGLLSRGGADAYIKGGALILLGSWFAGLAR